MKKIILVATAFVAIFLTITFWPGQNNTWHEENGFRWHSLRLPWFGITGFARLSDTKTGVSFVNTLEEHDFKNNRILLNGSGVAIGDVDDDGLADLYFCGLSGANVLYKNLGNWKFKDITAAAGVACPRQFSTGAVFADIDGDRDLDLIVTAIGGPNACFLNDGTGRFTDVTESMGLMGKTGAASMALADIDGDGDLDLYIANYKRIRARDIYTPMELGFDNIVKKVGDSYQIAPKFKDHYKLEIRDNRIFWFENGEPDMLFLNDGSGKFDRVSSTAFVDENDKPLQDLRDFGLTVRFQDMDDDNDPDIYVCNDFDTPDRIWINRGNGRFQAVAKLAIRKTSNSSMAVDFSDIDRDGDLDFFVVDMLSRDHKKQMTQFQSMASSFTGIGEIDNRPEYVRNTLFLNRGDNTYAEIGEYSGVQASEWSWSVQFMDVDLDGYEDILIPTGNFYDSQDLDTNEKIKQRQRLRMLSPRDVVEMYPKLDLPNVAFRNRGDLTFEDVSDKWGFREADISQGMAVGDLDNDGDLDMVFNRLGKTAALFKNQSKAPRIAVRLKGRPPNTQAIGAKIKVLGGPVPQTKEVIAGGSYLSHSEPVYSFAAGESDSLTINVRWRDGSTTIVPAKPNRYYEIQQTPDSRPRDASPRQPTKPLPYFKDVSTMIKHVHQEEPFDDFRRQPLLPNRLSQLGPGAAWIDIDGDGDDDLILPSGKGGQLSIFNNQKQNGFAKTQTAILEKPLEHDQTSIVGWLRGNGLTSLLVANSNYESSTPDSSFIQKYDFENGRLVKTGKLGLNYSSPGPMAMADTDNDGDLDLFVGGRTIPARYPEPASSLLFINNGGEFTPDEPNRHTLERIGMVSGAVFSDLDNDADPDLILALEWGPIVVLRNQNGRFENATAELGLAGFRGWWNGVTVGDLNEDGKLD
ncbi:MAG: VCBS repeat-containing protein, partial [bacterium]